MSRKTGIVSRAARATVRLAKRWGVQITFTNPGAASVAGLWALLDRTNQTAGLRHGTTDEFQYTFVVPKQTNFPPTNILPGATITFDGVVYGIDTVRPDNEDLASSATVALICGRFGQTAEIDG